MLSMLRLVMTLSMVARVHGFRHLLHCIEPTGSNMFDFPDLAEAAFANHVEVLVCLFM